MNALRRYVDREIAPALQGTDPAWWLACAFGLAVLMNKRYLCDRYVVPLPETRWQAFCAWQFACLWLLYVARRIARPVPAAVVATVGGAVVMALAMMPQGLAGGEPLRWAAPWASTPWLMLLLVWVVAAPAGIGARSATARPAAGVSGLLAGLAVGLGVLWAPGALAPLLHDGRYDQLNWGLLTLLWLLGNPGAVAVGLAGPGQAQDGWGLGRVRFWLPWTVLLLGVMLTVVIGFAGRQPSFGDYYPMFRSDWFSYDPAQDGWAFLFVYELTYVLYFLGWEYFYRGFMLFRLERVCGPLAILIQTAPFVMMHINKPALEFHSSLVAGLVLGWLAWRGRSFWPCFLLHAGVAVSMDFTVLLNRLAAGGR